MAKKTKVPTKEQAEVLKTKGMLPVMWVVIQDLPNSLICKHIASGEFRVVEKG